MKNRFQIGDATLFEDDALVRLKKLPRRHFKLAISSPPYNIRKPYERTDNLSFEEYLKWQKKIIKALDKCLADDSSVCWQVGNYVSDGEIYPLDIYFYKIFHDLGFKLRNRIIWKFNFGLHADRRFSGRYETILWFTKGENHTFNLDPVRIPQLYPGKRHSDKKGARAGKPSGNPLGKNPADYWEFSAQNDFETNPVWGIPNVKARHPEKTIHPCQFPIELAERCVLALTNKGDAVLDPFVGTGASVIAAVKNGRFATGIDKDRDYLDLAQGRLRDLANDTLQMRPLGKPVREPRANEKVAKIPDEWLVS